MFGTGGIVALALVVVVAPLVLLAVIAGAVLRRGRGHAYGAGTWLAVSAASNVALGAFAALGAPTIEVVAPVLVAAAAVVATTWRRGQRTAAGIGIAALGAPAAIFGPPAVALGGGALVVVGLGIAVATRADTARAARTSPRLHVSGARGAPGARTMRDPTAALGALDAIGPIDLPQLGALVAIVVSWLVLPFVLAGLPVEIRLVATSAITATAATEAFVRVRSARGRRAFEALSWLGEWELARARELTGRSVPTSSAGAEEWLGSRPERPEERGLRAEVLVLAGRFDEARAVASRMPDDDPEAAFARASTLELVDWYGGGPGDLDALRSARDAILPASSEPRLRADVAVALAEVRHRMHDPKVAVDDAAEPLVAVRDRLGARADGQVGRALRRRLFPVFLVVGLALAALSSGSLGFPLR